MTPLDYLTVVRRLLDHLEQTQLPAIERGADLIVAALQRRGIIWCAEIGHGIQGDFINRAGGLAAVKKYEGRYQAGDVLWIGSVSGRNEKPVELALQARTAGVATIGFTSLAYTREVASLHPSGRKLCEVVDVVIDHGAPYGDAAVTVPGYPHAVLPVSGVGCVVAGHMVLGRALEKMAVAGTPATVFPSINRRGGKEAYDEAVARYAALGY
jgi:uncharacterized phosphosugar-binding protein